MAKTYTSVPSVSTLATYPSATYNTYTAQNINNLIVPPACHVSRSTALAINNVVETQITWTVEDYDTDGMFTASSTDITVQTAGMYHLNAGVFFAANVTGSRYIHITKNGTSSTYAVASASTMGLTTAGAPTTLNCSTVVSLAASDVIRVLVYQASGGSLNVGGAPTSIDNGTTFCSVTWIGRTS